jgi:hypothetical protein
MTDLPGWLQEIRDRADKATPGPWEALDYSGVVTGTTCDVRYVPENPDAQFIAHARTDVPRLIALVGEMAEKLEGAVTVLDDIAAYGYDISKVPNIVKEAILGRQALAKYHGEAENNG